MSPVEKRETRKLRTKRAILDFFSTSRVKPVNSIKCPSCPNVSRGILLAIVFVILFVFIIVWFLFTDANEEDIVLNDKQKMGRHSKHNKFLYFDLNKSNVSNISEMYRTNNNDNNHGIQYEDLFVEKSQKVVVFVSTVSIVICIIIFVFVSAIIHYFRSPIRAEWSPDTSLRRNMFSSIFSYNRHLTTIYLLDQAIARDEIIKSRIRAELEQKEVVGGEEDGDVVMVVDVEAGGNGVVNRETLNKSPFPTICVEEAK
jgi:hypothetical protein